MAENCYMMKYRSPIGLLKLASDGMHITGLWIDGQKYDGALLLENAKEGKLPVFDQAGEWLDLYFSGMQPGALPPLAPKGSDFRQAVWQLLLNIPYGSVTTYGAIAKELEKSRKKAVSAQAVGGAVGHNPISILIPCHRVVGSDGSLTGYAGGIDKKRWLLEREGVSMTSLYMPKKGTAL